MRIVDRQSTTGPMMASIMITCSVSVLCFGRERAGEAHLVNEDDGGRVLLGQAEDVAHHARALGEGSG